MKERLAEVFRGLERRLPDRLSGLLRRVADGDILASASSLAFYGLVSALPLLLITVAVTEAVTGEDALRQFVDDISQNGPEGTASFLDQVTQSGGSLTLTTLFFTLWPATAYGGGLRRALTRHSSGSEAAPGVRGRLLGLAMALVLPTLVLAGIPLAFFLTSLSGDGLAARIAAWTIALLSGTLLATVLMTVLYQAFAPQDLGFRETVGGAVLTAVLTTLFSLAFVFYLQVGEMEERFGGGTIAIVVLIGIWLFVANILLLGGYETILELEGILADDETADDETADDETADDETADDGDR